MELDILGSAESFTLTVTRLRHFEAATQFVDHEGVGNGSVRPEFGGSST